MSRSAAKILSVISAIAAVVVACLFIPSGNQVAITIVCLIYLPIGITLLYFQRCPHCGRWPRKGDFFHEYCPRCGKPLEE